jgi:malate dehydrogenase
MFFRIFGVTTLDVVRASTFVSEALGDISLSTSITVPVVGGHSGVTVGPHCLISHVIWFFTYFIAQIIPLLSQASHPLPSTLSIADRESLVKRIQFGGDEVVKAKDGAGSATLSMAYAGAEFASKVLKALKGEKGIIAPSFVHLSADRDGGAALKKELGQSLEYFSSRIELGVWIDLSQILTLYADGKSWFKPEGVEKIYPLGEVTDAERILIEAALPELSNNVDKVGYPWYR